MKTLLKIQILICILLTFSVKSYSQIQITEPDSVVSFLNGNWDLKLMSGGYTGNVWTPEQLGYDLRLEFGILPDSDNEIFYQSFKNDTLINYKEIDFEYKQGWFGEHWYFDSLFIYTDDYYQYFNSELVITFYNDDSITVEETCFDCFKYIYERKKCEIFDSIIVYDTANVTIYDSIQVYDTTYVIIYDSIFIYDTTNILVYDTIPVLDSITVFDTIIYNVYDTTYLIIYDSILVYDTSFITVYDTLLTIDTLLVYDTITIIIYDTITSISENKTIDIKISPNPAQDKILVQSPINIERIAIFNMKGELIKQEELNVFETILDLENNKEGMYIVKIQTTNGIVMKKLIIR